MYIGLFDGVVDAILTFIYETFYRIGAALCRILEVEYELFRVFTGIQKVSYKGEGVSLVRLFFNNSSINTIYAGMACIGTALLFGFAILAVLRKMFDIGDKVQAPMGEILRKVFTSMLFMMLMTAIIQFTLTFSETLMTSIEYLFTNVSLFTEVKSYTFTESDYATMARIYDTIGNYSLNKSYNSRYNINKCFNEIRPDMDMLESEGVFKFTYTMTDDAGNNIDTWQSVLSNIARASDLTADIPVDEYNVSVSSAILNAMEYVKVNQGNMIVLQSYENEDATITSYNTRIDVLLWLAATTNASKNRAYTGTNSSFYDPVRSAYINGDKDMYNLSQVERDFYISFDKFYHLFVIFGAILMIWQFLQILVNCVARIFNMLLLYIVAPLFLATSPFDDGAKFKQWTTAFIIQTFGVFGTIISLRLFLIIVPIIFDSNLIIATGGVVGGFINVFAKIIFVLAAAYTANKSSELISGILAENAGMQSIMAGNAAENMGRDAMFQGATALAGKGAAGAIKGGWNTAKNVASSPKSLFNAARGAAHGMSLNSKLQAGGDTAKRAAHDFMSMDKDSAMKQYGMSSKQYDKKRSDISWMQQNGGFDGPGGGSGGGPGGGGLGGSGTAGTGNTGTGNLNNLSGTQANNPGGGPGGNGGPGVSGGGPSGQGGQNQSQGNNLNNLSSSRPRGGSMPTKRPPTKLS